jgi:hypothetical protein
MFHDTVMSLVVVICVHLEEVDDPWPPLRHRGGMADLWARPAARGGASSRPDLLLLLFYLLRIFKWPVR